MMKCERCHEKEASFYYSSNINGNKTERHLCADCAREEGFGGALDYSPAGMLDSMFGDMFSDFFEPGYGLLSSFGSFGLPTRRILSPSVALPRVNVVVGEPEARETLEASETKIPDDAGADVKARREVTALKQQLEAAVKAENFEKAIELRDRIRKLES